jgi:hypothetical protein
MGLIINDIIARNVLKCPSAISTVNVQLKGEVELSDRLRLSFLLSTNKYG